MSTQSEKDNPPGKQKIDIKNTAIKFALDQTLGAMFNTVLFIAGIGALKGMDANRVIESIKRVWSMKTTQIYKRCLFLTIFDRIHGHYISQEQSYGLQSP